MKDKRQFLVLEAAGFRIKFIFEPTELIYYKNVLMDELSKVFKGGGFLTSSNKKANFEIFFVSDIEKNSVLIREFGKKYYFLSQERNFSKRKVTIFYSTSLRLVDILLRDIFAYLLKGKGFLLHCSAFKDGDGVLHAFLAPSGGGKTTAYNLLFYKGFKRFNDDILIIKKGSYAWKFFSPPFIEKQNKPIKNEVSKAKIYFVEKAEKALKTKIEDKKSIVPKFLEQIWLAQEKIDRETLKSALAFVSNNDFYYLSTTLNRREVRRVFNEN